MRSLIAVLQCHQYKRDGRYEAASRTWALEWPTRCEFVLGAGDTPTYAGELCFEVPDDYWHMAWKDQAIARWALGKDFDYVFLACADTYIIVPHLLASGFERYDYSGKPCENDPNLSGGCGYWLSRKALEVVANATPRQGYDDAWVGDQLRRANIHPVWDWRYGAVDIYPHAITCHLGHAGDAATSLVPRMKDYHARCLAMMQTAAYQRARGTP